MAKAVLLNRKLKFILFLLLIFTYDVKILTCELFAQDQIVAIVNADIITQKDLNDFINFMRVQLMTEYRGEKLENKIQSMKLDLIDKLIEDRIILQEAQKNKIQIDEARVKAKIAEIRKHYGSDREFQEALSKQGLVQADIEKKIREQLLMYIIIDIKIKGKIIVKPSEVTDFYQENIAKLKLPEIRECKSVTIDNGNLAWEVYNNLKNGQEFEEAASKHSLTIDKFNATQQGQLRRDIEETIFKLHLGEISLPAKIENSYYIFKLDNIIPGRQQSLAEAQDDIYALLFNKKMEESLATWLDELKKHSYIKILEN